MKITKSIFLLPLLLAATHVFAATDVARGKLLHGQSCSGCHDTSVYSRPNKRITDLNALHAQVSRCARPAGAEWDKQELADVVEYLNQNFYQFK